MINESIINEVYIEYGNKMLMKLHQYWASVSSKFSADKLIMKFFFEKELIMKLVVEFAQLHIFVVISYSQE